MALVQCVECGRDISTDAKACPGCGKRIPSPALNRQVILGVILVVVIGLAWAGKQAIDDETRTKDRRFNDTSGVRRTSEALGFTSSDTTAAVDRMTANRVIRAAIEDAPPPGASSIFVAVIVSADPERDVVAPGRISVTRLAEGRYQARGSATWNTGQVSYVDMVVERIGSRPAVGARDQWRVVSGLGDKHPTFSVTFDRT